MEHLEAVKNILRDVLGPSAVPDRLSPKSRLLGSIPELDSMAVISLLTAIEDRLGIAIDDDEISAHTFETLGSLTRFVEDKLAA